MSEVETTTKPSLLTVRLFQEGIQFFEQQFAHPSLIIGREETCDLVIQDKSISRKHLKIETLFDKVFITDLGSSNGTFVDNQRIESKVEVTEKTYIRAGTITIQLIPPQVKKTKIENIRPEAADAESAPAEEQELTLSKIAFEIEAAVEKAAEEHEDVMAMVSRDFVTEMTRQNKNSANFPSKKIECLVLWSGTVYKIQEFGHHDTIVVGPDYDDSIHIPSVPFRWALSQYEFQEAVFQIPKSLPVFAIRGENFLSKEQLLKEKRIFGENQNSVQIQISHYDVLRIEIDKKTQLYFRYVPSAVELDTKKLLNPDEGVKKAIKISLAIHVVLAILFMLIPKDKIKAPEKKPPERVAKLIVEPKPEPPPPPPPPEPPKVEEPPPPPPEPPKEVKPPEPKPEPPKEIPKPKPEPKPEPKPKPKLKPKAEPKPVPKQVEPAPAPRPQPQPAPAPVQAAPRPQPQPQPVAAPPAPPPPKPVDVSKLGALAAIGGLKLDAKSSKPAPVAINVSAPANTIAQSEAATSSITSELKSQSATLAASNNAAVDGPIRTKGTGSAKNDYGTEGIGSDTGKRSVKGSVVGKPSLAVGKVAGGKPEGLSQQQVLKAMQPYLGKIQSCYERSLLSDPNLAGRIEFEWNISPAGNVSQVEIKKNSVAGGEQLGECVSGVIRSIKFPQATNNQETNPTIGFPFGRL